MWPVGEDARWSAGAACGLVGPAVFIVGWAGLGAGTAGYSALRQPISDLARIGAPHRLAMTAALFVYGLCMLGFAPVAARAPGPRLLGPVVGLIGIAALGVAAFPLTEVPGSDGDAGHALFAVTRYLAATAAPLLGGAALWARGARGWAGASFAAAAVAATALTLTVAPGDPGLAQRVGLSAADLWLMAMAARALGAGRSATAPATDGVDAGR